MVREDGPVDGLQLESDRQFDPPFQAQQEALARQPDEDGPNRVDGYVDRRVA